MNPPRKQKITVDTKGGLLAAFECAICDIPGETFITEITLLRKSGKTTWRIDSWRSHTLVIVGHTQRDMWDVGEEILGPMPSKEISTIRSIKRSIRAIPAANLLA